MLGLLWVDSDRALEVPENVVVFEGGLGSSFWGKDAKEYWLSCVWNV
jgi:hypothetical protein